MRLLLDTHIAVWAILDEPRLSRIAHNLIADLDNQIFVSVATLWEIAIKFARRRGRPNDMPMSAADALQAFGAAGYEVLNVTTAHALAVSALPLLHADPFDRMLIAQSRSERLKLLTADATVASYGRDIELI